MKQVSTRKKSDPKWWTPEPGEEVFFRPLGKQPLPGPLLHDGWNLGLQHGDTIPCRAHGTFETSHQCFFCWIRTGVFVGALLTFFLEGPEAAKVFYDPSRN